MRRGVLLTLSGLVLLALTGGFLGFQADPLREITILHVNDLHAQLNPDRGRGGFAHLVTLLERERSMAHASLTLNGGDLVQGTPVSTLFEGVPVFEVANVLGIDVNCLGNHEFDYGWRRIPDFMRAASFPTVSANVLDAAGNRLLDPPYVIRDVGGVRVAVVGAMMENLLSTTTQERLGPWRAAPLVETLRPVVEEAGRQADLVIVLGHLMERDIDIVLRDLPGVAVVVAGHNHGGLEKTVVDGRIGVNAPAYGAAVGRLTLQVDPARKLVVSHEWTLLPVDAEAYPADPDAQALVDAWEARVTALVDVPIGRATRRLGGQDLRRWLEGMLAERTGADFGFQNAGGIRDAIPEGELLARHVWNLMPFDDEVVVLSIPGRDLQALMQGGLRALAMPAPEDLDPARIYRIATSDFIAQTLRDRGSVYPMVDDGTLVRDLYIEGIRAQRIVP